MCHYCVVAEAERFTHLGPLSRSGFYVKRKHYEIAKAYKKEKYCSMGLKCGQEEAFFSGDV